VVGTIETPQKALLKGRIGFVQGLNHASCQDGGPPLCAPQILGHCSFLPWA
jgi:hypothetical protein